MRPYHKSESQGAISHQERYKHQPRGSNIFDSSVTAYGGFEGISLNHHRKGKSNFIAKMALKKPDSGKAYEENDEDMEMIKSLKNIQKSEIRRGPDPD